MLESYTNFFKYVEKIGEVLPDCNVRRRSGFKNSSLSSIFINYINTLLDDATRINLFFNDGDDQLNYTVHI